MSPAQKQFSLNRAAFRKQFPIHDLTIRLAMVTLYDALVPELAQIASDVITESMSRRSR